MSPGTYQLLRTPTEPGVVCRGCFMPSLTSAEPESRFSQYTQALEMGRGPEFYTRTFKILEHDPDALLSVLA